MGIGCFLITVINLEQQITSSAARSPTGFPGAPRRSTKINIISMKSLPSKRDFFRKVSANIFKEFSKY